MEINNLNIFQVNQSIDREIKNKKTSLEEDWGFSKNLDIFKIEKEMKIEKTIDEEFSKNILHNNYLNKLWFDNVKNELDDELD